MPFPSNDQEAVTFRADRTADYLAVGANADLTPIYRKNPGRGMPHSSPAKAEVKLMRRGRRRS